LKNNVGTYRNNNKIESNLYDCAEFYSDVGELFFKSGKFRIKFNENFNMRR
jgi:hypothetical protein